MRQIMDFGDFHKIAKSAKHSQHNGSSTEKLPKLINFSFSKGNMQLLENQSKNDRFYASLRFWWALLKNVPKKLFL